MNNKHLSFSKEVQKAFEDNTPLLALESTLISHGLPYPQNIEVAKELENVVRINGVTPATIAIMDGKIKIGLDDEDLKILATDKNVTKVSRRNLSQILINRSYGSTTVAATMICANLAGISVFATGGIGGVHRGVQDTLDISADLIELSKTPVIVISAGAKSILDLHKTMEFLETMGVPVLGWESDFLPAFYSSTSNIKVNKVSSVHEITNLFKTNASLNLKNGILVTNPIPKQYEIPFEEIEETINNALIELKKQNIKGPETTPFLLSTIHKLSCGKTVESNIKLLENNVILGSQIAKEI